MVAQQQLAVAGGWWPVLNRDRLIRGVRGKSQPSRARSCRAGAGMIFVNIVTKRHGDEDVDCVERCEAQGEEDHWSRIHGPPDRDSA